MDLDLLKKIKKNSIRVALNKMNKNSIRVTYDSDTKAEFPIGCSKIGGKPDLPKDFKWFYFNGIAYDEIEKNRPLSFLAQINCKDAKKYDIESLLPAQGILYFFYEIETLTGGFDSKDKGSAKVYYYAGSESELRRTDFPTDLLDEYKLPEMTINFESEDDFPCFEEFIQWHPQFDYKQSNTYEDLKGKLVPLHEEGENINKLLGYANLIQDGMLLDCELVANGICTGTSIEIQKSDLKQYKKDCIKWQLLFQLDSIQTKGYEMVWGDVGRIYFYIRRDDLKELNFDNCWLILQCY